MRLFPIILTVFAILRFTRDFKRDKAENKKAKVYHAILLPPLIWFLAGSVARIGFFFRNYEVVSALWGVEAGFLSGEVRYGLTLAETSLSFILLILAYSMTSRKRIARKWFLRILPFLSVVSVFNFYGGLYTGMGSGALDNSLLLFISITLIGGICTLYMLIYSSVFMKSFFEYEPQNLISDFGQKEEE